MLCNECGHLNLPYTEICEKCNSVIPPRDLPPPQTGRYDALALAAQQVRSRQVSSGEFRDMLETMEGYFAGIIKDVQEIEIPEEMAMETEQEISTGIAGLKLYIEALHEMHHFLDTRQEIYLDRGLAMARDANGRLNEALRLNWESFRNIQETAEEFLQTQSSI